MTTTNENYFDQYDDTAYAVCASSQSNSDLGIDLSNSELCDEICDILDVEFFDLFEELTPAEVLESDDPETIKAHAFLYLLRWQTFATAKDAEIGLPQFNELAIAHSELWYIRFTERFGELHGTAPDNTWVN